MSVVLLTYSVLHYSPHLYNKKPYKHHYVSKYISVLNILILLFIVFSSQCHRIGVLCATNLQPLNFMWDMYYSIKYEQFAW